MHAVTRQGHLPEAFANKDAQTNYKTWLVNTTHMDARATGLKLMATTLVLYFSGLAFTCNEQINRNLELSLETLQNIAGLETPCPALPTPLPSSSSASGILN